MWDHEINSTDPKIIEELENTPGDRVVLYSVYLTVREDECCFQGYEGYAIVSRGFIDLDGKTFWAKDMNVHIQYANKFAVLPKYPEEGLKVSVSE